MFQHHERPTLDSGASWVSPPPHESDDDKTDRLVLHGLRCGKTRFTTLAYHVGLTPTGEQGRVTLALRRLVARGQVRKTSEGWAVR